ncbi:MAG: hypothetical protein GY739_05540, partial [Mesoflavibacter sp.]|nr:hypothetical protein [Mesoflavibacter sp.]
RMERDALWARIEIRNGDYGAAHKRLKKTLRLASPTRQRYGLRALLWQVRLGSEAAAMSEAYGLLSVAAHETGNDETLRWASGEATARGVDLDALDRLNP